MKPIYLATLLLAACAAGNTPPDTAPEQAAPAAQPATAQAPHELSPAHGWHITRIGRHAADGTLDFDGGSARVSASFGCNGLSGSFSRNGRQLQISGLTTTLMLCPPPVRVQEERFSAALARVAAYRIRGQRLELLDGRQRVVLQAEPRRTAH